MKLTKEQFLDLGPCQEAVAFAGAVHFDAVAAWKACGRGDWLIWLLRRTGQLDKPTSVKIAVTCARHVLKLYEVKRPTDKRPRAAIAAAVRWLRQPTESNRAAAAAAYAAADAGRASERGWQADAIRRIVRCPFTN